MKGKNFLFAVMLFVIFSVTASAVLNAQEKPKKPDLVALSMNVTVKDGSALAAGKDTMVSCSLKNMGELFTAEFRISIQMDGSPLGLPMGSTATPATTSFATPWVATAGAHSAKCILDTQNVVNESNETNNSILYRFTVPKGEAPDLVALSMKVTVNDGTPLNEGKATMVGCSLKNNGGPFTQEFRIGIQMDGNPLGLPMGSTATPTTTGFATPWVATAGVHSAKCIVDTQNVINESNEANNIITYRFIVPKAEAPDLVALSMGVTVNDGSALTAGKDTMVGCKLKNNGGPFTAEFRIGIHMDGVPLGLPMGSTATPTTTGFATPWIATAGTHIAKCIVDTQNVIIESNETNNIISYNFNVPRSTYTIGPKDLDISVSTAPKKMTDITIEKIEVKAEDGGAVAVGKQCRIYCHWKRTGAQPANVFRVYIGIDGTALTLPQGDTVDHTQTQSWLGTPWTATAGNHQIKCEVDTQNVVNESNEKNNKWIQLYNLPGIIPGSIVHIPMVKQKTDVMIEKIEVKAEDGGKLTDGKDARIFCYWKRTGPAPAADFRIAVFVDGHAVGLPQGSTVQHELESGWLGTPWKADTGFHQPTIECLADSAFEIAEPNETNNKMSIRIDIPAN